MKKAVILVGGKQYIVAEKETLQMAGRFKIWRKPGPGLVKKLMNTARNITSVPVGVIYPTSASHTIHRKNTEK